jgi:hypothetical protein
MTLRPLRCNKQAQADANINANWGLAKETTSERLFEVVGGVYAYFNIFFNQIFLRLAQ